MVIPPEVVLLLRIVFAILGFLLFQMNLQIALFSFVKNWVGWQESNITVSWETLPVPDKYRSGCSQLFIGWSTGSPMEKLEKVSKDLKGFSAPQEEQQYELTSTPRAPRDYTTNQTVHMVGFMTLIEYVAEACLFGHQWEKRPLVLWKLYVPVLWNARTRKREWVGSWAGEW